jgi:hypothetical protein
MKTQFSLTTEHKDGVLSSFLPREESGPGAKVDELSGIFAPKIRKLLVFKLRTFKS